MLAAPHGAVFVWLSNSLGYARVLAEKIGRDDLKIVGPSWFASNKWRGLEMTGIVIDHAAQLTDEEMRLKEQARCFVGREP
jgi:hypothetical protein